MRYEIFRLLLLGKSQLNLFGEVETREDFLRRVFADRINFVHRKLEFSYVPIGAEDSMLVGRLGRKSTEQITDAPDTGFAVLEREGYRAVNIFMDVTGSPDGQTMAIQDDARVGQPNSIIGSLQQAINNAPTNPWHVEIRPVTFQQTFWDAVAKYKNQITVAEFNLVAPNLFGLGSTIETELREANQKTKASEVEVSLKNEDGLELETEEIKQAAEYISLGGGGSRLKRGAEIVFDSKEHIQREKMDDDEVAHETNRDFWKRAFRVLFKK